jgi:hypothetical protein
LSPRLERPPYLSGALALSLIDSIAFELGIDGLRQPEIIVPAQGRVRASAQLNETITNHRVESASSFDCVLSPVDDEVIAVAYRLSRQNRCEILAEVYPGHGHGVHRPVGTGGATYL